MKHIFILLACLVFSSQAFAQEKLDRSVIPAPGPAPEIKIGSPYTFTLENGLKVFVVENHKLPRVSFSLQLDIDPILEGNKAGYVSMAGTMLRRGTTTHSKDELDEAIDFMGATLSTSSGGIYASSLSKHTEKLLALMTEVLYTPSFPEEELEKIRKETLSGLQADKEDPESISSNVTGAILYGKDHPYGELITEETVKAITIDDVKSFYNTYFKPNIGYLAIVGDITPEKAEQQVKKYFSKWEKGSIPTTTFKPVTTPEKTSISLVDRNSAVQSIIKITYPIDFTPGNPDAIKASLMNKILGGGFSGRLFANLREKHAFTYGAYSSLSSDELVGNFSAKATVRNEVTDSAVVEFFYEMDSIIQHPVDKDELQRMKNYVTGSFARGLEDPATVARFAINIDKYNLPKDYYTNYLKQVESVTVEDIQAMAKKYIKPENAHVVIVGKGEEVAEGLEALSTVKYFDIYGEPVALAKMEIPAGVTANTVINDYINAVGGAKAINKVKAAKTISEAEMGPQKIAFSYTYRKPDMYIRQVTVNGSQVVMKEIFNGTEKKTIQGANEEVSKPEYITAEKMDALPVPEIAYQELGIETTLKGIENIDGKNCYAIEIIKPSNEVETHYYDLETKLKNKVVMETEGPNGVSVVSITYADYQEVDGIKIPFTMSFPIGANTIQTYIKEASMKAKVSKKDFTIEKK